ncbi:MAG TPA: type II toxin-antitoxin system RelE/ParE family toxin [Fodinibius sp.]|nr:type II toxin-antitoxin system RelE/ParE family toxin [Fodinibius sp.]
MKKKPLAHGRELKICYLEQSVRYPELIQFMDELEKKHPNDFKKAFQIIFKKLKDNERNYQKLGILKKLRDDIWEVKIKGTPVRFLGFYSNNCEFCISHGCIKKSDNSKRFQNEIDKAITRKKHIQ